jgi:Spy/CpxP family protein refolding chaperone
VPTAARLPLVALLLVLAAPTETDSARWWHSPRIAGPLGLRAAQVEALDRIYDQMVQESGACASRAARARETVERLLDSDTSSPILVDTAAAALADARSEARRSRTLRLYGMYRVLTPEQRLRLFGSSRGNIALTGSRTDPD